MTQDAAWAHIGAVRRVVLNLDHAPDAADWVRWAHRVRRLEELAARRGIRVLREPGLRRRVVCRPDEIRVGAELGGPELARVLAEALLRPTAGRTGKARVARGARLLLRLCSCW